MTRSPRHRDPNRISPPRTGATKVIGVNPEEDVGQRTMELATDQSIAARHLLYEPNETVLDIIKNCANGANAIVARLAPTGDATVNITNNEIIVSMFTRLMADGGTGRIKGFDDRLAKLAPPDKDKDGNEIGVNLKKTDPAEYERLLKSLADDCRANISKITSNATKPGPEGALARQGILGFMGDLGGFEPAHPDAKPKPIPATTGFNGYKGPLCSAELVYEAEVAGIFNHQRNLAGQPIPPSAEELAIFRKEFDAARDATSVKGGVLSAPLHTKDKKGERSVVSFKAQERRGLLNTGDIAEGKLTSVYPGHQKTLVNAAWPTFHTSEELAKGVAEPVTGHISGTFGEMVTTMNMLCGTPPATVNRKHPAGNLETADGKIIPEKMAQAVAITGLASAGLITSGFHSAVETYQPMSTFCERPTLGSLGPEAVANYKNHADALKAFAESLGDDNAPRPSSFVYQSKEKFQDEYLTYKLEDEELSSSKDSLLNKAESIEDAATKATDMISLLQGADASTATRDVSRVMSNLSTEPNKLRQLYSLDTRLAELGERGGSPELKTARELAAAPVRNNEQLALAITLAEAVADNKNICATTTDPIARADAAIAEALARADVAIANASGGAKTAIAEALARADVAIAKATAGVTLKAEARAEPATKEATTAQTIMEKFKERVKEPTQDIPKGPNMRG